MNMGDLESFHRISDTQAISEAKDLDSDVFTIDESRVVDGVRMTPGVMVFANAFEGKTFNQKLVIQNGGKKTAFVRLCDPNSQSFKMKTFKKGLHLSPGLKITRTVVYTYSRSLGVTHGFVPICINEKWIQYKLYVTLSVAVITLQPEFVDFGRIDAVNAATTRTLTIRNTGSKGYNFAIDLGRNELELIVEPMKGIVHAMNSVTLRVELVGSKTGDFVKEFWIKSSPPQRIIVKGTFIEPKLFVGRNYFNTFNFTIVEFPRTYYGARCTKPLILKNYSSSNSMFYVMAEYNGNAMPLRNAKEIEEDYNNFFVSPIDGRMYADRGSVVQITFTPRKQPGRKQNKEFFACFLRVLRMRWRDIASGTIKEIDEVPNETSIRESVVILPSHNEDFLLSQVRAEGVIEEDELDDSQRVTRSGQALRVCLHGEKEIVSVTVRPDLITLKDLHLNQVYKRTLYLHNQNCYLPIILKYVKIASIEVFPEEFELKAKESLEVNVSFRTARIGKIVNKISFDLLYYDLPNKDCLRKVGRTDVEVTLITNGILTVNKLGSSCFAKQVQKLGGPKATPNLHLKKLDQKNTNKSYNASYLRQNMDNKKARKLKELIMCESEYDLTNSKWLFRKNTKFCSKVTSRMTTKRYSPFIPLTPKQLHNIKIFPKFMRLKKIAAYTVLEESFSIINLNEFPIRIYLTSSKLCVAFRDGRRAVINGGETKKIPFIFSSFTTGKYNVTIEVVVNESHVFQVATIAEVISKRIRLASSAVHFDVKDDNYKFIQLFNDLNAPEGFYWEIPPCSFKIYPMSGTIPSEHYITCMITYKPNPTFSNSVECSVNSDSGVKQTVQLSHNKCNQSVYFNTSRIDVGVIPLNMPSVQKLVLKNLGRDSVIFRIDNPESFHGITISPVDGVLKGKGNQIMTIVILLKVAMTFWTKFTCIIEETKEIEVNICGQVEFPQISLQPDFLQYRKISPYAFDCLAFKITNVSKCKCLVNFPMDEYPDFSVTESEDRHLPHEPDLTLEPQEAKLLFLHFHPYNVATYHFFLPFVLNNLIGPPSENGILKVQDYVEEFTNLYKELKRVTFKETLIMSTIRINCGAIEKFIESSSLNLKFYYFCENHYNNKIEEELVITNTSEHTMELCIRTDEATESFSIFPKDVSDLRVESEIALAFFLQSDKRAIFQVNFHPQSTGRYYGKLPIFLRNYQDCKVFNYIDISGIYEFPSIIPPSTVLYFESVPLRIKNEYTIVVILADHFKDCKLSSSSDIEICYVIFNEGKECKWGKREIAVTIGVKSNVTFYLDSRVILSCTCGSCCQINLKGVIENGILTTHWLVEVIKCYFNDEEVLPLAPKMTSSDSTPSSNSLCFLNFYEKFINNNESSFPFFPNDCDESIYAKHMRQVLQVVENWVYCQGFSKKRYYKIPEDFLEYPIDVEDLADKKKNNFLFTKKTKKTDLPLIEFLLNLIGNDARKKLVTSEQSSNDELHQMAYRCTVYTNLLDLLGEYQVSLPHVQPHLLLSYDFYILHNKIIEKKEEVELEQDKFFLRSKQCWLDLILQIIKRFVLFRVEIFKEITEYKSRPDLNKISQSEYQFEMQPGEVGIYSSYELTLILWLRQHYAEQKSILWPEMCNVHKQLEMLDDDLKDGVILGAVTAAYCPYVKNVIGDMFATPVEKEEIFHNACLLVQTWKLLKLSYEIEPNRIVEGCMVEMLLLVTYLHEVLPNCYPKDTITIAAPLSGSGEAQVQLTNCGNDSIQYEAVFFDNNQNLFEISKQKVFVAAHKQVTVKVKYRAKYVSVSTAFLLVSGETPGYKYGKSVAFNVVGIPDVSYVCAEIPLQVNLYRPCTIPISLQSPYKMAASYDRFIVEQPVYDLNQLKGINTVVTSSISAFSIFNTQYVEFDENGQTHRKPIVTAFTPGTKEYFVYFLNKKVGDWAIKVQLTGKVANETNQMIEVDLPPGFDNTRCTCKYGVDLTKNCSKVLKLPIPSMNLHLWEARRFIMLNSLEGKEHDYWIEKLQTDSGIRIMELIVASQSNDEKNEIFKEYKILPDKNQRFTTPNSLLVPDATSRDTVDLPIHANKNLAGFSQFLRMDCVLGTEVRIYKIKFNSPSECI